MIKLQKILAGLALLLGLGHIIFGLIVFKTYNLELVWFIGAGIAMIVVALTNLTVQTPLRLRIIQNLLMMIYSFVILAVLPAPQVIIACVLFGGLFAVSAYQGFKKTE